MLTHEKITEFKELVRQTTGKELSEAEATRQATSLINLMRVIYRPIPAEDHTKAKARIKELNEK